MQTPIRRPAASARPIVLSLAAALALAPLVPAGAATARPAPDGFADLVAAVAPAVVQISTRVAADPAGAGGEDGDAFPPFADGPGSEMFRHFFGRTPAPDGGAAPPPQRGLGSGFLVGSDGLVVTNNHVVGGAERITVRLADGREYPARLLGADDKTDLALLRISADGPLPSLEWGRSEQARIGDWVVAVGNPFGLEGTVTAGILSSRGRDNPASPYVDFLQIDASLNRGNSGGPLLDKDGRVIGVNTAILSPNGGNIGIGFAIPSETAAQVVADLGAKGSVERGWLGVAIQPVTPEVAESLGLAKAEGALVASVQADGPAATAGVRPGDVVVAIGGTRIATPRALTKAVAASAIGKATPLTLVRGGQEKEVGVTIAALAADPRRITAARDEGDGRTAGVAVAALGLRLAEKDGSAVVVGVDGGRDAAEKGIRPGDIIRRINDREVRSAGDVDRAVAEAAAGKREAVLLLIENAAGQRFVPVRLASA